MFDVEPLQPSKTYPSFINDSGQVAVPPSTTVTETEVSPLLVVPPLPLNVTVYDAGGSGSLGPSTLT